MPPFPLRGRFLLRRFCAVFSVVAWTVASGFTPSCGDPIRVFASRSGEALVRLEAGSWDNGENQEAGTTATVLRFDAGKGSYEKASAFPLRSEWLPAQVVLTDRAEFIVVLNHAETQAESVGAIVVYRPDGSVVKQWSLLEVAEVAGRMQIDFAGGLRWAGDAVLRGAADRGFVQIWLLADRADEGVRLPQLRLDLVSMTLVAVPAN